MPFRGNFKRFKFSYIFADLFLRTRLHNSKQAQARARARALNFRHISFERRFNLRIDYEE